MFTTINRSKTKLFNPLQILVLLFVGTNAIFGEGCHNLNKSKCSNLTDHNKMAYAKRLEGFIVGGRESTISLFPHAVCLFQFSLSGEGPHAFCGSSVLNQKVLLTAAHCVDGENYYDIYAYGGHEDVDKVTIIRKVDRFFKHERYDPDTVQNDIALLFIDKGTIPLGGTSPIKRGIISSQFPLHVHQAKISGWGLVDDEAERASTILKVVSQNVYSLEECITYQYEWMPGMMCAGDMNSEQNRPSRGDSGGGLITTEHQIIGIVSFTAASNPGLIIYTNVSDYYHWVVKTTNKKICET